MNGFTAFCAITLSAMVIAAFGVPAYMTRAESKGPVPAAVKETRTEIRDARFEAHEAKFKKRDVNAKGGEVKTPRGHIKIESPKPETPQNFDPDSSWVISC